MKNVGLNVELFIGLIIKYYYITEFKIIKMSYLEEKAKDYGNFLYRF